MIRYIDEIENFKNAIKQEVLNQMDLFMSFGSLKSILSNLNSSLIDTELKKIEEILRGSIKEIQAKLFDVAISIGTIENIVKNTDIRDKFSEESKTNFNEHEYDNEDEFDLPGTLGAAAAFGARTLMGAGPLGMLAAGVLGVASGLIFSNNGRNPLNNIDTLKIAYYLSMYDHEGLFGEGISSAKGFEALGQVLGIKPNTLRGKRDYFDSLIPANKRKSPRKGYESIASPAQYEKIIKEFQDYNEPEMRKVVVDILGDYQKKEYP